MKMSHGVGGEVRERPRDGGAGVRGEAPALRVEAARGRELRRVERDLRRGPRAGLCASVQWTRRIV